MSKHIHVLAGDALASDFAPSEIAGIAGEVIVSRECFIEGPLQYRSPADLWQMRARYLEERYQEKGKYFREVVPEYEKLLKLPADAEIYLWFEYDLFCQVNLWFVLNLIGPDARNVYRVFPSVRNENDIWKGFGRLHGEELRKCFDDRVKFGPSDIQLGADLWTAYRNADLEGLEILSTADSRCFPYLKEVCRAEIERKRDGRPQETLRKIAGSGGGDFAKIFQQFGVTEGIYGFGDQQVKAMYEGLNV